jgi:hypothetical protein
MGRRIALWTLAGAVVAFLWFLYFTWLTWGAYHGGPAFEFSPTTETIVNITAPVRPLFGRTHAITWYWSIVMNAAIYACIGLMVETVRLTVRFGQARLRH